MERRTTNIKPENWGKPWTSEDDTILQILVSERTKLRDMAYKLSRTAPSVDMRIAKLKLERGYRHWNEEDINTLLMMRQEKFTTKEIGFKLGRTTSSVCNFIWERGLAKKHKNPRRHKPKGNKIPAIGTDEYILWKAKE